MRDMMNFAASTQAHFENNYENMLQFNELLLDTANGVHAQYTKEEANKAIRAQFDKILGINFKEASTMKRRQAWRAHGIEIAELIEDVLLDRMNSGFTAANAAFMEFVEEINLAEGDKQSFYVEDPSLLQVSVFAGNHHDVVRQAIKPGKEFSIETSSYVIKGYTDYVLFASGKIDWAGFIDKMYRSIEQNRYAALYAAFMSLDQTLPSDMKAEITLAESTKAEVVDMIEDVKAATGYDCVLVGARPAIQALQNTVSYRMFSDDMKNEKNQKGILGNWEGYACLALDRVNKAGTRENIFSAEDNKKIFIMPIDPQNKPIKRVNEGDVAYYESGMDGMKKDMTVDVEIVYNEGIGVVVNQLCGVITIGE